MHARQGHDDNPRATLFTHVCMKCNTLLNLGYDQKKGACVTTRALAHFKNSPECDLSLSDKVKAGNTNRHNQLVLNMLGAGASNSASQALVTAGLVLDPVSRALTKAARFYIYAPQRISKTTFTDPYFKDMINAYYKLGGGQGEAPVLTVKAIKKYVDAEFECFLCLSALSFCMCSPEVTVTSLRPPRLCRLAVFSIKPNFSSGLALDFGPRF